MRRTSRLFEIIQILRSQDKPITAQQIAGMLEVSKRTVYRDIAALQAMRTPIDGEAGIGYVMRRGYDLPPLNFDNEEIEAISVGLSLLSRTGDSGLEKAASKVWAKIENARGRLTSLKVSEWGARPPENVDMTQLRRAIRNEQKLSIRYVNQNGDQTERIILPIAVIYYLEVIVLVGWCELRQDFRHFRVDRMLSVEHLDEDFKEIAKTLRQSWRNIN